MRNPPPPTAMHHPRNDSHRTTTPRANTCGSGAPPRLFATASIVRRSPLNAGSVAPELAPVANKGSAKFLRGPEGKWPGPYLPVSKPSASGE